MDETLSVEERAALKARAIASLRQQEADLEKSHAIHRYQERGLNMLTSPKQLDWYNRDVRDLQRAGESVPNVYLRAPHIIRQKPNPKGPMMDWIDGSNLLADIKNVLALVDPRPE
jgi:hypothetical protein